MERGDEVLAAIEETAKRVFLPIIGREKGSFLERLVKRKAPKSVLEIGTLIGYSGIRIARSLQEGSMLVTLEISRNSATIASHNFKKARVQGSARIIVGDALEIIPKLKAKFDFVFIDGEKRQYKSYLKLLEKHRLLEPNTTVVADNVKIFASEMRDYLDYVRSSGKYKSSYHDFGWDGMEVSRLL